MRKTVAKSAIPITIEIIPINVQASHAGMNIKKYFSEPIMMKMDAVPINEVAAATKTIAIIDVIKSFLSFP